MAKHSESQKWQGDLSGEEDSPDLGRDVGECIAHATDHEILKWGGSLHKWGLLAATCEVALVDEACGQLVYLGLIS